METFLNFDWLLMIGLMLISILLIIAYPFVAKQLRRYIINIRLISRLPGPPGLPIFGPLLNIILLPAERRLHYFKRNFQKHGNVFKLFAFPIQIIASADADVAEALLSHRANVDKSYMYSFIKWMGESTLTLRDSSKQSEWSMKRKALSPSFNSAMLNSFSEKFAQQSRRLLKALEEKVDKDDGFDICPYINNFTMNVVCETLFGLESKQEKSSAFADYTNAIDNIVKEVVERFIRPWLWLDFTYSFTNSYKRQEMLNHTVHSVIWDLVEEKKENLKETEHDNTDLHEAKLGTNGRKLLVDYLLHGTWKDKPFSDIEVRSELSAFLFGGSDTTATSISFTLYLLGTDEDVQEKVVEELEQVLESLPPDGAPSVNQVSKLKYLECVIKESLRLFPPIAMSMKSPVENMCIKNYKIPANTFIIMSAFHLHRNPLYYPNPDSFNPENFNEERTKARHPFAYLPFSSGPRNCIGQKFAMLEMKIVLSMFLRKYKIVSFEKLQDLSVTQHMVLCPTNELRVRISKRK